MEIEAGNEVEERLATEDLTLDEIDDLVHHQRRLGKPRAPISFVQIRVLL